MRHGLFGPGRLEERLVVQGLRAPWTFDLGYRNGRINVINSLALTASNAEANLGRALVLKGMVADVTGRQDLDATAVLHLSDTEATTPGAREAVNLLEDADIEIVALPDLEALVGRVEEELLAVAR